MGLPQIVWVTITRQRAIRIVGALLAAPFSGLRTAGQGKPCPYNAEAIHYTNGEMTLATHTKPGRAYIIMSSLAARTAEERLRSCLKEAPSDY